ncbi:MAG: hypothetical protein HKN76_18830 [Saprospiraceae bacterium]|nr:hypothetical protein [Saprospiraceae bacterium]
MFENLHYLLSLHGLVGASALLSFWIAATARKGGKRHITAGRIYLISMCLVLISTIPLILHFYFGGNIQRSITLLFLFFVVLSAIIMLFFSIRNKNSLSRHRTIMYKIYAIFMSAFSLLVLYQAWTNPLLVKKILLVGFASIGLIIGISMAQLAWAKKVDKQWWLRQHMNGAMVAFAATHASFFGLGLRKLMPALAGDWMHTVTQVSILVWLII